MAHGREPKNVETISVRISIDDKERLQRIATRKRVPPAMLARNYLLDGMDRDEPVEHGTPERFGRDEEGGR